MMMNKRLEVILSVLSYSVCSATLVLLNKLTLYHLPYPSLIVSIQLIFALAFISVAKYTNLLQVDPLKWQHIVPYLYYTVLFSLGVYSNMRSLAASNVETVIVFRSLTPCLVAFLDALFLGREYPNFRGWSGMALIVLGALGYASLDEKFQTQGLAAYSWPVMYLVTISLEMAYGKKITRSVDLKTLSGPVLYTNLLGLPPMLAFAVIGNEFQRYSIAQTSSNTVSAAAFAFLALGCIAGTGIGYSGWWCRDKVSATTFTLVGVINKCLTILLNVAIWDQHAPFDAIMCLFVCLIGGSVYQQAPMRADAATKAEEFQRANDEESGQEKEALLVAEKASNPKDQVKRRPAEK